MPYNNSPESGQQNERTDSPKVFDLAGFSGVIPKEKFGDANYLAMLEFIKHIEEGTLGEITYENPRSERTSIRDAGCYQLRASNTHPELFIKFKQSSGEEMATQKAMADKFFEEAGAATTETETQHLLHKARTKKALISGLNEIVLYKDVAEVVNSKEVQDAAKKEGFSGIRYIEPEFLVIDSSAREKYLAYPFVANLVEGRLGEKRTGLVNQVELYTKIISVKSRLSRKLEAAGIMPGDLATKQIHYCLDDNYLYLFDIEGYYRRRSDGATD